LLGRAFFSDSGHSLRGAKGKGSWGKEHDQTSSPLQVDGKDPDPEAHFGGEKNIIEWKTKGIRGWSQILSDKG